MIGSPFSPWYAAARRTGERASPRDHAALNVAVYGPRGRRAWVLSERALSAQDVASSELRFGSSRMTLRDDAVVLHLDETTSPWGRPLRGRIVMEHGAPAAAPWALDGDGLHGWWPIAPRGRVRVELDAPALSFTGNGYHDANAGDVPLERSFRRWSWARGDTPAGETLVAYDVTSPSGRRARHMRVDDRGAVRELDGARITRRRVASTLWGLAREVACDEGASAKVLRTYEDTPFYARSLIETRLDGRALRMMHEQLALDRFERRWVQFLLGYRMTRVVAPRALLTEGSRS